MDKYRSMAIENRPKIAISFLLVRNKLKCNYIGELLMALELIPVVSLLYVFLMPYYIMFY